MRAEGKVIKAVGNLIHVEFEGHILQGEVAFVQLKNASLEGEVIEIKEKEAKIQVFEDTREVALNTPVSFTGRLLEAELGPGLLTSIFDGLQNPLEKIAEKAGFFLQRGIYFPPLDRTKKWHFNPLVKAGDTLKKADVLGSVPEGLIDHKIMIPFALEGEFTITWIAESGDYTIEDPIAKAKDANGKEHIFTMMQRWPVKKGLLVGRKVMPEKMMDTGLRILDTQFPVLKGGTFCTPGPFGAGKTVLQHHLAKFSSVDIVIMAACGERAGEVVEILREFPHLVDEKTKKPLIERTVIIANTSSMPVAAREASVYMAITIAEYYRQMGLDILVLADSTSRWAQAMREMSGRLEEIPGEEAFPAYLASRIASFYERAGSVQLKDHSVGSVTIGGSVSPAGGSFEEPVTQATLSVVGAFLGLSRERSDARKYPAIDPLISWTKYLSKAGEKIQADWDEKVKRAMNLIAESDEIAKRMEVVGEEGTAVSDLVAYLKAETYDYCYLQQNAFDKEDQYCSLKRQIETFDLLNLLFEKDFSFDSHDSARTFFLNIQNDLKNLNYLSFHSDEYQKGYKKIQDKIQGVE